MGEKIRDVHTIHLAKRELMVELNEGYTRSQGRVIHIQNKEFRFLIKECDFTEIASLIMRADVEFEYIKNHPPKKVKRTVPTSTISNPENFNLLRIICSEMDYRIVSIRERWITVIVPKSEIPHLKKLMKMNHAKELNHPMGQINGFSFLYQMEPFHVFFCKGLYYEFYCQLPCMSLTPKTFIPLDRRIQEAVWMNERKRQEWSYLGEEEEWIYRLSICLFLNRNFNESDIAFFIGSKDLINRESLVCKLMLVVFSYTPYLLNHIREERFDLIITDYYSFENY